jgi:hypothetical protein
LFNRSLILEKQGEIISMATTTWQQSIIGDISKETLNLLKKGSPAAKVWAELNKPEISILLKGNIHGYLDQRGVTCYDLTNKIASNIGEDPEVVRVVLTLLTTTYYQNAPQRRALVMFHRIGSQGYTRVVWNTKDAPSHEELNTQGWTLFGESMPVATQQMNEQFRQQQLQTVMKLLENGVVCKDQVAPLFQSRRQYYATREGHKIVIGQATSWVLRTIAETAGYYLDANGCLHKGEPPVGEIAPQVVEIGEEVETGTYQLQPTPEMTLLMERFIMQVDLYFVGENRDQNFHVASVRWTGNDYVITFTEQNMVEEIFVNSYVAAVITMWDDEGGEAQMVLDAHAQGFYLYPSQL